MSRTLPTLVVVALFATVGCRKQVPVDEPVVEAMTPMRNSELPATLSEAVQRMSENFQRVHFALDSSTLDDASKAALVANVRIMQAHPGITVEVQGHADERGTVDYNLALGDRRAAAVKKHMTLTGVGPERIVTVSYGEEKPRASGSNEVAWSQNRRAEFRILAGSGTAVVDTVN